MEGGDVQPGQELGGGPRPGRQQDGPAAEFAVVLRRHAGRGDGGGLDARVHGARRKGGREQFGERVRAALGQTQPARRERVQREVGAPARRPQRRIAQQGGEEGAQKGVDRTGREAPGGQRLLRGEVGAGEQALRRSGGETREGRGQTGLVEGAAERSGAGGSACRTGQRKPGALARARAVVSAPLALRGVPGAPAWWCRPSLCSSTPGENGRRARASRPGVWRSSGYEVDRSRPSRSSRKPSTFSVDIRPPT